MKENTFQRQKICSYLHHRPPPTKLSRRTTEENFIYECWCQFSICCVLRCKLSWIGWEIIGEFTFGGQRIAFSILFVQRHFSFCHSFIVHSNFTINLKTGTKQGRDHCDVDSHPLNLNVQCAPLEVFARVDLTTSFTVTRTVRRLGNLASFSAHSDQRPSLVPFDGSEGRKPPSVASATKLSSEHRRDCKPISLFQK